MAEFLEQQSNYIPPQIAVVVGYILSTPRQVGQSADFLDLFSEDEDRHKYVDGLLAVSIIFMTLYVVWGFLLIVLKFKGDEVGCASGNAFAIPPSSDDDTDIDKRGKSEEDVVSTSDSSSADSIIIMHDHTPIFSKHRRNSKRASCSTRKLFSCLGRKKNATEGRTGETRINPHERRTRIAFLLFASVALICAPFTLFLTFGPLQETMMEFEAGQSTENLFSELQNIVDEVEIAMKKIETTSDVALDLVNTVPTDLGVVCPNLNNSDFEFYLGVDINGIIDTIIDQQYLLRDEIESQFSVDSSLADGIENALTIVELYTKEAENYIWILPGLLLLIGGLTTMSIVGVVLAWKEKSGSRFQRFMSYVVLPLLILAATACWLILMAFSLSTMLGTDICLTSSLDGSPDETIVEILSVIGNGTDGSIFDTALPYIDQCNGSNPTQDIEDLKRETQGYIDNIWRQISKIDAAGRASVIEKCGGSDEFQEMLTGARELAMSLTKIRRELSNLEKLIGCDVIHPLYTRVAHDTVCMETLSASAYGFVTFLVMWTSVMAMISLRASWLSNIEEERVYHDEAEGAENMVVDEHEEYLAYISRYKHEWQEYEGFSEEGAAQSSPRTEVIDNSTSGYPDPDYYDHGDDEEYYYGDHEDYGPEDDTMGSESMYIEDRTVDSYSHGMVNRNGENVSHPTTEDPFAIFPGEGSAAQNQSTSEPTSASSSPLDNQSCYDKYDPSFSVDWNFSEDGISQSERETTNNEGVVSCFLPTCSSDSPGDTRTFGGASESGFENTHTHELQSTGEVEVQLHDF